MLPEVRALADKLVYDVAMLKYLAAGLPKGGLDRGAPGGWTVRHVLAHLAESYRMYVAAIDRLLAGDVPLPTDWDPERINAALTERHGKARLPTIVRALADARDEMILRFEQVDEAWLAAPFGRESNLGDALRAWSTHAEAHALDLVDALVEIRFDPMLLNWVLHADYAANPERNARQRRLFEEVREQFDYADEGDIEDEEGN